MPALMGWTAATGRIELAGLAVFGVLFFWQVPHFHAIAMYRMRDYDNAGLKTLPGTRGLIAARREIALYLVVQVAISFAPVALGVTGLPYLITAAVLGAGVLVQGFAGAFDDATAVPSGAASKWARNVFLASIIYLPVLFAVMVIDGRG
jgi:protoheme IX farnesyltransferase